jgi:hypothetical protein
MRRLVPLLLFCSALAGACLIGTDDYGGKSCKSNKDCPEIAGYLCVAIELVDGGPTWPQRDCRNALRCVCEVQFPPEPGGIQIDGGMNVRDAGPPPDYCEEVRPILQRYCLGTCHGDQMGYPNSPPDFRLDYYSPPRLRDGGLGLPGVSSKADRVQDRIYRRRDMPPLDFPITPTTTDRALVDKWVRMGFPLGDGGCEVDAGPPVDAGNPDGGPPVSFSVDVVPIFQNGCRCHTGTNDAGSLSLNAGVAYNALVGRATSMGCQGGMATRVVPNAPMSSQLWLKLANDPAKCNAYMPPDAGGGLRATNPAQFDLIDKWIRQGARNN